MKTEIFISGQISGNSALKSAIITSNCELKNGMFNSYTLVFPTKKDALKALWEGYKYLKRQDNNPYNFSYHAKNAICYDASIAKIITPSTN